MTERGWLGGSGGAVGVIGGWNIGDTISVALGVRLRGTSSFQVGKLMGPRSPESVGIKGSLLTSRRLFYTSLSSTGMFLTTLLCLFLLFGLSAGLSVFQDALISCLCFDHCTEPDWRSIECRNVSCWAAGVIRCMCPALSAKTFSQIVCFSTYYVLVVEFSFIEWLVLLSTERCSSGLRLKIISVARRGADENLQHFLRPEEATGVSQLRTLHNG